MTDLLTWPAYGTWLPGPAHGCAVNPDAKDVYLPAPDYEFSKHHRKTLKWPVIQLDEQQRNVVHEDLKRIATFRPFQLISAVVAPDYVHVLMTVEEGAHMQQVIQLIKGSTARALTVALGDEPATDREGAEASHHKWWSRQYILQHLKNDEAVQRASDLLAESAIA